MRKCGSCHECCIGLPIQSLKKREGVPCVYLGEEGCDIYGNHPEVCRSFTCRWLEEDPLIEEAWRPDKCGFLLWKGKSFGRALVCLKVTREEANNSPEFREAVLRYGKGYRGKFSVMKKRGEGGTKNKNISEED